MSLMYSEQKLKDTCIQLVGLFGFFLSFLYMGVHFRVQANPEKYIEISLAFLFALSSALIVLYTYRTRLIQHERQRHEQSKLEILKELANSRVFRRNFSLPELDQIPGQAKAREWEVALETKAQIKAGEKNESYYLQALLRKLHQNYRVIKIYRPEKDKVLQKIFIILIFVWSFVFLEFLIFPATATKLPYALSMIQAINFALVSTLVLSSGILFYSDNLLDPHHHDFYLRHIR